MVSNLGSLKSHAWDPGNKSAVCRILEMRGGFFFFFKLRTGVSVWESITDFRGLALGTG